MKLVASLGGIFVLVFRKIHHSTPVHLYQYSDAIPDANLLSTNPTIDPLS